jgi:hypothetical protein
VSNSHVIAFIQQYVGGKRGITSPEQGNAGLNLGPELRSAFDVPIPALTRPEEERILSDLPLEGKISWCKLLRKY